MRDFADVLRFSGLDALYLFGVGFIVALSFALAIRHKTAGPAIFGLLLVGFAIWALWGYNPIVGGG